MIIESGPDFRYSQLGSLLGGHSVKYGGIMEGVAQGPLRHKTAFLYAAVHSALIARFFDCLKCYNCGPSNQHEHF